MGFPDLPMFLSEKGSITMEKESRFPITDTEGVCRIAPSKDVEILESKRSQENSRVSVSSSLKIIMPSEKKLVIDQEDQDGCKTPTRKECKIPQICPGAPRKPKRNPGSRTYKLGRSRRRLFLDFSSEVDSLFPESILADFGNKIKKVRKESIII